MKKARRGQKGFTLLEIIVVLAVIGALAAMLAPVVFRYIDDAKRAQAQNDTRTIASAIQQMYKDTGRWAFYDNGTGPTNHGSTDTLFLTSNNACNADPAPFGFCDATLPTVGSGTGWPVLTSWRVQAIASQLIENDPGYATTGPRAWKGPYLDAVPATDPWSRSYLVNINQANPAQPLEWVVVVSAGPNGILETMHSGTGAGLTQNPTVGGDDVIQRVK